MAIVAPEPWYEQAAQVIFYLTPAIAFILTGFLAIWKFNVFRTAKPSIKVDLEVTSRASSESSNVISAVALVTNTSRVIARCSSLQWEVRVLAPFDDEDVETKVAEYADHMTTNGPGVDFPWNVQYRIRNDNPSIALEPGESNVVDISLAIPDWITAVDVRCTMVLPKGRGGAGLCVDQQVPARYFREGDEWRINVVKKGETTGFPLVGALTWTSR